MSACAVQLGLIRHVGFSTHGQVDVIVAAIQTGSFDFVNLHYHFVGSYTASGSSWGGEHARANANLQAVEAAARHDMGVFVISPFDKVRSNSLCASQPATASYSQP